MIAAFPTFTSTQFNEFDDTCMESECKLKIVVESREEEKRTTSKRILFCCCVAHNKS